MPKNKELQQEIEDIQALLYQERQDHGNYVKRLKETAYKLATERMRVKSIKMLRDNGNYEVLQIDRFEEEHDGINIVVANVR